MPLLREASTVGYFSHIPKCAGSSIIQSLKDKKTNVFLDKFFSDGKTEDWRNYLVNGIDTWIPPNDNPCSIHHWHASIIKEYVKIDSLDFSFAMMRDPVDRMCSEYKFRRRAYATSKNFCDWKKLDLGSFEHDQITDDFGYWLRQNYQAWILNPYVWDNHFRPQSEFIISGMTLMMYPNFEKVCDFIQNNFSYRPNIPWKNKSISIECTVTKDDRQFIEEWYNSDYEIIENKTNYNWY